MLPQQHELIGPLLRQVSRSFYVTLRVLPAEIRPQISLSYLLARATDTIADTRVVPRAQRLEALRQMRLLTQLPDLGPLREHQSLPAERLLLERLGDCLAMLAGMTATDRTLIFELLQTIMSGQIFDLERFPGETAGELVGLSSAEELDRYTYLVAGCVGEFWTKMCRAHLPALSAWDEPAMISLGIRFGKGLQLVNVLRDVPRDLHVGRCYLPVAEPRKLLDPGQFPQVADLYGQWLTVALDHLDAGWQYTLAIPPTLRRLRLACIWPIWIGLETIALLRRANPLDPARRIQIPRSAVYGIMVRSALSVRSDRALSRHYDRLRRAAST